MITLAAVVPSWRYWHNPKKLQPLWELYYATLINERFPDAVVDVIDLRSAPDLDVLFVIPQRDVYFYWIMKTADSLEIYALVKKLKSLYPKSKHIAGGTHVDHQIEECMGIFDACVVGTGEELVVSALQDLRRLDLKRVYMSPVPFHFENYSYPRRDFMPYESIVNADHFKAYGEAPGTGVYFSRGCSFSCNFCVYNNPSKFQLRTSRQIDEEIGYLKREYRVKALNLRDEVCLPVNKKEAFERLEVIGRHDIIWRGQTVPFGSEEVVAAARASGCVELALGVESVESDEVLRISNKPLQSVEASRRYIELLKKYGIKVKICLIFGLPGEGKEVLQKTIRFLEDTAPDYVALSGFDPVPGSAFFKNRDYYGIKTIDEDKSKHVHLLYRFGDTEEAGLPFEYEEKAFWGHAPKREEIEANMKELQAYLRQKGMCY